MSTTWSGTLQIKEQIQKLVDNPVFETGGSLANMLLPWTNAIVMEVCHNINIRVHLKSASAVLTTSNYVWQLPADFLKMSSRFTKFRVGDVYVDIIGVEELNAKDPDHSETTSNSEPESVAIEGGNLYIYPAWAGTGVIENFYRRPTDMVLDADIPDIPEETLRTDLIVAGVVGKYCFPHIEEFELAKIYYNAETYPESGRFFTLLGLYKDHLGASASVWTNRGTYI